MKLQEAVRRVIEYLPSHQFVVEELIPLPQHGFLPDPTFLENGRRKGRRDELTIKVRGKTIAEFKGDKSVLTAGCNQFLESIFNP